MDGSDGIVHGPRSILQTVSFIFFLVRLCPPFSCIFLFFHSVECMQFIHRERDRASLSPFHLLYFKTKIHLAGCLTITHCSIERNSVEFRNNMFFFLFSFLFLFFLFVLRDRMQLDIEDILFVLVCVCGMRGAACVVWTGKCVLQHKNEFCFISNILLLSSGMRMNSRASSKAPINGCIQPSQSDSSIVLRCLVVIHISFSFTTMGN